MSLCNRFLPCDNALDRVAVQGTAGLGGLHEHVIVRSVALRDHEHVTIPGHMDLSDHLLEPFLAALPGSELVVPAPLEGLPAFLSAAHVLVSFLHFFLNTDNQEQS